MRDEEALATSLHFKVSLAKNRVLKSSFRLYKTVTVLPRTVSGRRRLRKEARVEKLVTAEAAFDGQPIRSKFLHLMRSVIQKNKPDFILLIHRS